MGRVLTAEQLDQVIHNTMVVLLVRPDLLPEWRTNLMDLLRQTRTSHLDEESIFVAAVLALLHSPDDTLPTGTNYDSAWQSLLTGLRTGVAQPSATQGERMALDRLLNSVAEAVVAVVTQVPAQREAVSVELSQMRRAAVEAGIRDLATWIDDALAVLDGAQPRSLVGSHQGVYAAYWDAIVRGTQQGE